MKVEDIKINITFTQGYQQRFTEACLKQLDRRQAQQELHNAVPWMEDKKASA